MMTIKNIFACIPKHMLDEAFEVLLKTCEFKLERIVSRGHCTPAGQWYDQPRDEWVILLKGSAGLRIDGQDELVRLGPGDYVHLPAHLKHRVEWTDPESETVWLALHYFGRKAD